MIRRGRRHRDREAAELNITAFMNLMVILVPFLLITAVFSRVAVLELNLPSSSSSTNDEQEQKFNLELVVRESGIAVADRNTGVLKTFKSRDGEYDLAALSDFLQQLKVRFPDKTEATLLLEPEIEYDLLVQVMDTVRVTRVKSDEEAAEGETAGGPLPSFAELFPDISIGDAPVGPAGKGAQR